ncbi:response regulator transcription factor [Clostridium sp. CM028]|uniref:response regulator transcription factor n=1 Tax=unclassified Clostridium TaxID=2614128 RepID=UPI001C0BFFF1|nr:MULTISPECIES: response regulator transcription factor [unclassified Clostridium]MBU3090515.1 response regulator transcription factor [Clostridium sp. CF011]MBW9145912.1 response regulator transcription factor [Clostridium sp. CM027]MBW9149601.1 response regulator transcription factor [Clostridium sp. CM028]UVE40891.1 response regulator transcription factor [Clostridium sp. CM027]WAG69876.1 response regulator transcription factor [Clostridium sp. CF011]
MNRLLLVEDDESLALGIEFSLKDGGYEVSRAATVEGGKKLFHLEKFDLILLDVNLPDGNGYELCKYIRSKSDVLIIFLTACDDEVNIVQGLEIGGDDYITKPFRVRELLSRIKALIRRNSKNISIKSTMKSENILVDNIKSAVWKNGEVINLTAQEYKLLLIFMNKPNVLMKRDEILCELLEGEDPFFDENTLSVYIKRIRDKIEDNPREPQYIVNKRGLGYKWNKEIIKG